MRIVDRLKDKDVLVWGYGREGKSTEQFIKEYCSVKSLTVFEGKEADLDYERYDYIIKSPGIRVDNYRSNFTSQTELFLEEFADRTVGITGTKGKSTTSSLLYHVLSRCLSTKVLLVGNIGLPCLDCYGEIDKDTTIVFEMSCHQLSNIKYSPHIAVFLNLYEDHLDYYGTREKYCAAKTNIISHQQAGDYCFTGESVPAIDAPSCRENIADGDAMEFEMNLKGAHNQYNATYVYRISSKLFGCRDAEIREAIKSFQGLAHRLEHVGCVEGVDYYNDSISTIPEATIQAVRSVANTKTVLIGGMDRHINYDILIAFIKEHPEYQYILSYESGLRIYEEVKACDYCTYREDLGASVALAKEITPAGGACVFSPAAASYGYFKNFEERGEVFKQMVLRGQE